MKSRYRNASSLEIRDVEPGSDEESQLQGEVYTAGGLSRPMWMLEDSYQVMKEQDILDTATKTAEPVTFGNHQRRLTPGEVAMGIKSYEHKLAQLGLAQVDDRSDELDDDEEEDDEPLSSVAKPRASRRRTKAPAGSGGAK